MHETCIVIFVTCGLFYICLAANILVLEEIPVGSHHSWMKTISYELAGRGHNVTSLSAIVEKNTTVHYLHLNEIADFDFMNVNVASSISMLLAIHDFVLEICKGSMKSNGWQQLMDYPNDFKFDLIIFDYILCGCHLIFVQKFNYPPILGTSSIAENSLLLNSLGYPLIPSINIFFAMNHFGSGITYSIKNYFIHIMHYILHEHFYHRKLDDMLSETFHNSTALRSIFKQTKLLLLNEHPVSDTTLRPSNAIQVSGLHMTGVKPLPKDLEDIMNSAVDGVILFAIGSALRLDTIDKILLEHIVTTFEAFPNYNFIWQYSGNLDTPKNVYKFKWIPQNDVLGHPRTKLFISHCGLLSIQEATYQGVPILGIPLANDQFLNSERLVKNGVAEQILLRDLTSELFSEKIDKLLNTPTFYHENMKKLSTVFKDQKDPPLERAIWWIEWLIRNPNVSFYHNAVNLNFMQRQSFDVLIVLEIMLILIVLLSYFILYKCCMAICKSKKNHSGKNNKVD